MISPVATSKSRCVTPNAWAILRRLGLLDIMLIRSAREPVTVVNVYEDDLDREAMQVETMRALGPALAGKLELLSREFGPAYDTADLLG